MPLILGTNSIKDTAFDVANSCRFNDDSSDYMHITRGSAGNQKTFTISMWIKRCQLGSSVYTWTVGADGNNNFVLYFDSNDQLEIWEYKPSAYNFRLKPKYKFRDVSAWYHLCVAFDTTQSTSTNRVKVYVNGTQLTDFDTSSYPSLNYDTFMNSTSQHWLGRYTNQSYYFDGYICEMVVIDGQQLDPTSFGEFDSDSPTIWKPKDVSGLTFGTNGFYLDFEDSSALGNDANGGSDFTVVNLTSLDQSTDTCTNNFATMNPLNVPTSNAPTFSEGNLKTVTSSSGSGRFGGTSTFGVSQGKWYIEAKATIDTSYSRNSIGVSYNPAEMARNNSDNTLVTTSYAWGWDSSDGSVYHEGSVLHYYATYNTGDICQIFLDLDNHKLYFGKNGTLQSSTGISLDTGETYFIAQIDRTGTSAVSTFEFNFGSPSYSISSSNTDDNGYGNFEYSPNITGDGSAKSFYALNTKNLAENG